MRRVWLALMCSFLVGCAAEAPDPTGPGPGDEEPTDPAADDRKADDSPTSDDRDLDGTREGMLEACLVQCGAMAGATECADPAILDGEVDACMIACPDHAVSIDDACVEVHRLAWECLGASDWSCFGGELPNVDAETCAAERAAAGACQ